MNPRFRCINYQLRSYIIEKKVIVAEKDLQLAKKYKTIDKHKNKTHNQTAQIEPLREYETRKIR